MPERKKTPVDSEGVKKYIYQKLRFNVSEVNILLKLNST